MKEKNEISLKKACFLIEIRVLKWRIFKERNLS